MTLSEQITEIRDWLKTWSGKLAAVAAPLVGVLSDQAATALGVAQFVPEGLPRNILLAVIVLVTFILPMEAQKKDLANDSAA